MGMPTIKMPAGVAPVATAEPAPAPALKAPAPVAPPKPAAPPAAAAAPAPAPTPAPAPAVRAPAPVAASASGGMAAVATNGSGNGSGGLARSSMISGSATKRSALVEATLARMGARLAEATGLAAGSPELIALVKLSTEVVERIVWEIVPDLAEQIIRENLHDLTSRKSSS